VCAAALGSDRGGCGGACVPPKHCAGEVVGVYSVQCVCMHTTYSMSMHVLPDCLLPCSCGVAGTPGCKRCHGCKHLPPSPLTPTLTLPPTTTLPPLPGVHLFPEAHPDPALRPAHQRSWRQQLGWGGCPWHTTSSSCRCWCCWRWCRIASAAAGWWVRGWCHHLLGAAPGHGVLRPGEGGVCGGSRSF